MPGLTHTGAYPSGWAESPDPRYGSMTDFVLAALDAGQAYRPGFPETSTGPLFPGSQDPLETMPALYNLGWGQLAPMLDTSNPRIKELLDSVYYSNTSWDNPFESESIPMMVTGAIMGGGAGGQELFGTGVTAGQAMQGVQLARTAAQVAQDPSGAGVGSLLGGLASAYTGVPGLSTVGSLVGSQGENLLRDSSSSDTLKTSGGGQVADTSTGINWEQLLPQLLAIAPGLVSSGIGLAGLPEIHKRLEQLYQQGQISYDQQFQLAQAYQQLLNQYQQQQQQAYAAQTGEHAQDRATNQQATQGRMDVAGRLSDPSQVAAGANALYQPMTDATRDELLRGVTSSLATRGITGGGAASLTLEQALAPYLINLRQQAMQNYLGSQTAALGGYNPIQGPYTPGPPAPPQPAQFPRPNQYVPGSTGGPQADSAGTYQGVSDQIAQLGKLLFGTGTASDPSKGSAGLLSNWIKHVFGGGNTSNPNQYGSPIGPTLEEGWNPDQYATAIGPGLDTPQDWSLNIDPGNYSYDFNFG